MVAANYDGPSDYTYVVQIFTQPGTRRRSRPCSTRSTSSLRRPDCDPDARDTCDMTQVSRRTLLAAGPSGGCGQRAAVATADARRRPGRRPSRRPVHARCVRRRPRRVVGRAVDPAHRRRPQSLPAGDVVVTWELATDADFAAPIASGDTVATAADGHSVHVVVDVSGPSWYRFRAGGWTSPVGRVAPADGDTLRAAATTCQHCETGYYAAHRDIAEWAPDLVVFLGDFIYEGAPRPSAATACAPRGAEPRTSTGTAPATPSTSPTPICRRPGGGAVAGDLGRPRGREQLRRAHVGGRDPADVFRGPAARRLPGVVGAHAGAHPDRHARMSTRSSTARSAGAPGATSSSSTVASSAATRRAATSRSTSAGVRRGVRSGTHDARRRRRSVARRQLAASAATWAVIGQQTVLTDLRLPNGAILNHDQWDGYARPATACSLRPPPDRRGARSCSPATSTSPASGALPGVGAEFVTTSSSPGGPCRVATPG